MAAPTSLIINGAFTEPPQDWRTAPAAAVPLAHPIKRIYNK